MRRLVALLLTGALASGCTLAPTYRRPPAPVPASFPQGPSYAPPAPGPAGAVSWRAVFTDPGLQATIALALEQNRDLRAAVANIELARAQHHVQRAALLPAINATGAGERSRMPASSVATRDDANRERQRSSDSAPGYFRSSAGASPPVRTPILRSSRKSFCASASWRSNGLMHDSARGVRRSLSPLPPRTMISRRETSTSFTRRVIHSLTRRPLPYISDTHRRITGFGR